MQTQSYLEKKISVFASIMKELRIPFLSALAAGFAAYMFCFVNKLEIMDDLACMFGQGATLSSGRWGLDIIKYFTPSVSLPWLNGILSLLLISLAACLVIKIFEIRNMLLRILLPAVLATFPSQTCTFAYMFTTVQYALSLLLAVSSVYLLAEGRDIKHIVSGCAVLVLAMGIYQPYVATAAAYLVVYVIFLAVKARMSEKKILRKGVHFLGCLVTSLAVYYGITVAVQKLCGTGMNEYGGSTLNGIGDVLFGIRVAYTSFLGYFLKGYYDLVPTAFSKFVHIVCGAAVIAILAVHFFSMDDRKKRRNLILIVLLCMVLLPPAVNAVRIISSMTHNLMLFSVTSVYVLAAVATDNCLRGTASKIPLVAGDFISVCIAAVICTNVYFANTVYFQMFMKVEQAESFYTSAISEIMRDGDFCENSKIAFVGSNDILYEFPMIETDSLSGIREGIVGTYSQREFVRCFLGLDLNICGWDDTDILAEDSRVADMPSYPYHGCIQKIDDYYVVKLG